MPDFHAVITHLRAFSDEDWALFRAYLHRRTITGPTPADDIVITCDVCADDAYWRDNGGPIARWFACGPLGLGCPGFGGS